MKKLSKSKKVELWNFLEWEGGLGPAIDHGGIHDIVKGTKLEPLVKAFEKAMFNLQEAIDAENIEQASMDDND